MIIDFTKTPDEILEGLREGTAKKVEELDAAVAELSEKQEESQKIVDSHDEVIDELKEKSKKLKAEVEAKERTYKRVKRLFEKTAGDLLEQEKKVERSKRELVSLSTTVGKLKEAKSKLTTVIGETLKDRVAMISALAPLIDTSCPVEFGHRNFKWTTAQIKIWDPSGVLLPVEFGRFEIKLYKEGNLLRSSMKALEPNPREGYPHPHVKSDGSPCLGNAGGMLLDALNSNNMGMAITTVHEFLTNYNKESPYVFLNKWIPNRWDDEMCACKLVLKPFCGCLNCVTCGSGEPAEGTGVCSQCLNANFVYSEEAASLNLGVAGTGWVEPLEQIVQPDGSVRLGALEPAPAS